MDPVLRRAYNEAYTEAHHRSYMDRLEGRLGNKVPFRVAETPLFLGRDIREKLERAAREVVARISDPKVIAKGRTAIPKHLDVPGQDALSSCIQVDFAIAKGQSGKEGDFDVKLEADGYKPERQTIVPDKSRELMFALGKAEVVAPPVVAAPVAPAPPAARPTRPSRSPQPRKSRQDGNDVMAPDFDKM